MNFTQEKEALRNLVTIRDYLEELYRLNPRMELTYAIDGMNVAINSTNRRHRQLALKDTEKAS